MTHRMLGENNEQYEERKHWQEVEELRDMVDDLRNEVARLMSYNDHLLKQLEGRDTP